MTTLYTWNVNGIRAVEKKGFLDWVNANQPDILCLQETKASADQLSDTLLNPPGYRSYFAASTIKKGYSGVALYTKQEPNEVILGLGIEEYDVEGRTIVAHYDDFTLLTSYIPNGSRDHSRVPFKMAYKAAFLDYVEKLRADGRKVIFCGDINTSHREIDIARPKQNINKTGFMPEERVWIDEVLAKGWIDIYRHLHPTQEGAYTWWTAIGDAREKNVGWRLDYFFITPDLLDRVVTSTIHANVLGSDHCPVSLTLA